MTYSQIINYIIASEGLTSEAVKSKSRKPEFVECRYIIWMIARKYTPLNFEKLAAPFNRDHSTVIQGIKKFKDLATTEKKLAEKLQLYSDYFENFDHEQSRIRPYRVGNLFWMRKKLPKKFRVYAKM